MTGASVAADRRPWFTSTMLPYFEQPVLELGPLSIYSFGVLVGIGILAGIELAHRNVARFGVEHAALRSFVAWILAPGFLGAHLFDALWYQPAEVLAHPEMLLTLGGFSSFGGFTGAVLGALAWRVRHQRPVLPYIDLTLSVFPIAWSFGRAGCTVAHDHPGVFTSASNPLAFAFPDGPRWDLGFLEMLFSVALSVVVVRSWRTPRPSGYYVALTALTYAPVRFVLDFLRADVGHGGDVRYAFLTPGPWASIALAVRGLWFARRGSEERGLAVRAARPA